MAISSLHVSFGVSLKIIYTAPCLIEIEAGLHLINETQISSEKSHWIYHEEMSFQRPATQQFLHVDGKILVQVLYGALWVQVWFRTVPSISAEMLLGTSFIDRITNGILLPSKILYPGTSIRVISWFHSIPLECWPRSHLSTPLLAKLSSPTLRWKKRQVESAGCDKLCIIFMLSACW